MAAPTATVPTPPTIKGQARAAAATGAITKLADRFTRRWVAAEVDEDEQDETEQPEGGAFAVLATELRQIQLPSQVRH